MFRRLLGLFTLTLLGAWSAYGQAANQIANVRPAPATQGTANLLVTFTLSTNLPPVPPAGVLPTTVLLGTNGGSSVGISSQYIVTVRFNIPALVC